ncbi:MAG: CocE/NonD family hydrolase [Oscillospiraceae bacterium]
MNQEFLCYHSGIFSGKAYLGIDEISYSKKSYYTDEFSKCNNVLPAHFFHPNLLDIWQKAKEIVWNEEKISFGEYVYERNISFGRGYVYAQMYTNTPLDVVICDGKLVGFMLPSRNESITLVIDGFQDCTNLSLWSDDIISKAEFQIEEPVTIMVAMSDGVKLATDVILPKLKDKIPLPTILVRTCYNKNANCEMWHKYAKRGYAVVVQDVRGREASQGEWLPFYHETDDGNDTLNWIANQKWSDGNVGMIGGSYLGYVQWAAAASGNRHLKALVSQVTAGSAFCDLPRRGGTFESGILAWSFMVAEQETNSAGCVRDDWEQVLAHRPICDIPNFALKKNIPFFDEWLKHENDDEFWAKSDWSIHGKEIDVPALYISGWFDDNGQGTTQSWNMNAENKRENQRMILGPWLHKTNSSRQIHDYELNKNALRYDLDVLYIKWLDHFLKGVKNNIENLPAVQYYMLGENQWKNSDSWPPKDMKYEEIYLHNNASKWGDADFLKVSDETMGEYTFDPQDPFPFIVDVSENEGAIPGNYKDVENRKDLLLYTSKPMTENLSINGIPIAHIYAQSSCKDTDWVVRITDVDEKGNSFKISDGIIRARYRNGFDKPQLLEPNSVEEYTIPLTKIAHTFLKNHKLRVQITSGADNFCFPNSNLGNNEATETDFTIAKQKIFTGGKYLSGIKLPIIR